ncbi:MAG TPA: ubiquinol-cytochrome c reductase iron-sulfur subunit [Rhodanobacteraceae bacterium]|nr:ubiquinol-cytochrome c reductase iron-sulfur subunit [Rhodanobacteraceae bacterium]
MADETINKGRRRFLTASTAVIGGAGLIITAIPFVKTWFPSARAQAAGAPVLADVSKVELGQRVRYGWQKQPIDIINRSPAQLATLDEQDDRLRDPECKEPQQPKYCQNKYRAIRAEWLVFIDICTHLGCVPDYHGVIKPEPWDPAWKGGYYCPCHHSRYDISARVFKDVPAPLNMVVMPYHWVDETHVLIGVDPPKGSPQLQGGLKGPLPPEPKGAAA